MDPFVPVQKNFRSKDKLLFLVASRKKKGVSSVSETLPLKND